jgi:excisionase family DNA binding protein
MSLRDAAAHLGVHPTTLRRWANSGELSVLLTPGGHRRFTREELDRFAADRRRFRAVAGIERVWSDAVVAEARARLEAQPEAGWLTRHTPPGREAKRQLGRRLMTVLIQYLGGETAAAGLDEARALGREHARLSFEAGLGLVEAVQALLFFRDTLVEVALNLPELAPVRSDANLSLVRRINTALNAVQLALVEEYERSARLAA